MKVCRQCNVEKPLAEFYKHSRMMDGHLNKCIPCVKSRVQKHREVNLEKIRAYDKTRAMKPHRVKARKQYMQTDAGKVAKRNSMQAYFERYPMIKAAHIMTRNAIRDKRLPQKFECSICQSTKKIEAHHDDYTKPFDIRWLCEQCHKSWHKQHTPIYK